MIRAVLLQDGSLSPTAAEFMHPQVAGGLLIELQLLRSCLFLRGITASMTTYRLKISSSLTLRAVT